MPSLSSPAAMTTRVGAARIASKSGSIRADVDEGREQRIVALAVILGRHPEHRWIGRWPAGEIGRNRPLETHDRDELAHRGTEAVTLVGVVDVLHGGLGFGTVRQQRREWRLMCDRDADILGVLRHKRQGRYGAAAAGEEVDRAANCLDHAVDVIGIQIGIVDRVRPAA